MSRWVYGVHPVEETLVGRRTRPDLVLVRKGGSGKTIGRLEALARDQGVKVRFTDQEEFERISDGGNHQGVAARMPDYQYADYHDWLESLKEPMPDVLILDGIQDPHNLGAIIRTADCFGIGGVVIGKDRSAQVTETAIRTSAGAAEHMPVVRIVNLARTLKDLKDIGYWIVGTDVEADTTLYDVKLNFPAVFIMGSEEKGMRPLTGKSCDYLVKLPNLGQVHSLNVSVASGVLLGENYRQKKK